MGRDLLSGRSPRRGTPRRRGAAGVVAGAAAFVVLVLLSLPGVGILPRLENLAGDVLRRQLAEPLDPRIELVALDDESLRMAQSEFGVPWPWPRDTYAATVDFLGRAGARAVVFDILFTSPMSGDEELADKSRLQGATFAAFESTAAHQPSVLARIASYRRLQRECGQHSCYELPILEGRDRIPRENGADIPSPPLWGSFAGIGDVQFFPDEDGLGRRARLAVNLDGRIYPALSLAAYWATSGTPGKPPIKVGARSIQIGDQSFPTEDGARIGLLFRQVPATGKWTRLFDLASSGAGDAQGRTRIDPRRFKDKIVLIGATAPGLHDLRPNPLDKNAPGLVIHATLLDNLLTGRCLRIVKIGPAAWIALGLLSIAIARLSFRRSGWAALLIPFAATAILLGIAVAAYANTDTLLPTATPVAAIWFSAGAGALEHFLRERRRRGMVEGAFGQVLSPLLVQQLLADERPLRIGGEKYELTLFFSDLQGFTSFSENFTPEQLVDLLNYYLTEMSDVLVESGAYVDKYVGDAIMAFWGAPVANQAHALTACRAAWRCQQRLAAIQPELIRRGLDSGPEGLVMRIGLNTGEAVVGMMGSEKKLNYTAMGDTVNLASRLEGTNKAYGSRVILSDATRAAAGVSIRTREIDLIRVKGKREPTRIFELAGVEGEPAGALPEALLPVWEAALDLYRGRRFPEARGQFERCLAIHPGDGPSALFAGRCREYESTPPTRDWDGVYTMKTK